MKRGQIRRGPLLLPLDMAIKKIYSLPGVKITKVKAIATATNGIELVVMKVKTSASFLIQ